MIVLDDHVIQPQWDASLIEKGMRDLERRFAKLGEAKVRRTEGITSRVERSTKQGSISPNQRTTEELKINALRVKAEQQITRLRALGTKEAKAQISVFSAEVRNLDRIEKQLAKTTDKNSEAFKRYRIELNKSRQRVTQLSKQTTQLTRKFTTQKFAANGLSQSLKNMARSYISVFAIMAGATGVVRTGRAFEDMSAVLLLSSGSAQQASVDFEYLIELSQRLGLDINNTAKAYAKFAVAGSTAGLANETVKNTFEDISIAIRATGLETQRANLAFLAFQQMLAGPVIQAQEMNQLVEQMPQFTGLAKKALIDMGHQVTNIRDTIATGTVDSVEFVQRVGQLMRQQAVDTGAYAKALESVTAQSARLGTALDLGIVEFHESGFREGFVDLLTSLTESLVTIKPLFRVLGRLLAIPMKSLSVILDILNFMKIPFMIILDSILDITDVLRGGFNKELEKGATFTNFFKRGWMIIAGLIKIAYGQLQIFFGSIQEAYKNIVDSDDPFALFSSKVGKQIDLVVKKSQEEGKRQAGQTVIHQKNEYNINGNNTDEIRSTIEETLQKAYSGVN